MKKINFRPIEYRKFINENSDFIWIDHASCQYCGGQYEKDKYYPECCAHCGAKLGGLTSFGIDPVTGEKFELILAP